MVELISITPSPKADKKYVAKFKTDKGRTKSVHFGATGYDDFIKSKSEVKKSAYIARHKVNENFQDPTTAGALSRWVLWNKPTLNASIQDYKQRFNL